MHSDRYLANVRVLCDIALRRLPSMLDRRTGLFILRADGEHLRPSSTSVRYSAFVSLGLERAEDAGLIAHPPSSRGGNASAAARRTIPVGEVLAAMDAARPRIDNAGDLGLILWAAARRDRAIAEHALTDLLHFGTMAARRGAHSFPSMELAWIVTGLAEALEHGIGPEREVRARLDATYRLLLENRGRSGMMAFARWEENGLRPRLESTLGFFDAQVYTIVASLKRDDVLGDLEAREVAIEIGRHILRHQQSLGQWPWHYNAHTGRIVDMYPVYSVHQDAMAPMALLPLERANLLETTPAVAKGVAWLFGDNELGTTMADASRNLIWRSIRRKGALKRIVYPLKAASLAGIGPANLGTSLTHARLLEIDHEMRPYHLGLCLYAFAEIAASAAKTAKPAA
jgi:hypothetical protein